MTTKNNERPSRMTPSKRLTLAQRCNQTPYNAGERRGRQLERARAVRILKARITPYDDEVSQVLISVIRRIQGAK